jgi:type IV secretory pathway protease TraF
MVTARLCTVVSDPDAGVTFTVGATVAWLTVTEELPEALFQEADEEESGVYCAERASVPTASDPAGMVMVAVPEFSVVAEEV